MPTKKAKKISKTAKKSVSPGAEKENIRLRQAQKKTEARSEEKAGASKPAEKYFFAIGKRKTSVAQVRIYRPKKNEPEITVNEREFFNYFPLARLQTLIVSPLAGTAQDKNFSVSVKVAGGGTNSQAEAIRLGISKALVKFDETLKKQLKDLGFLTRDSRIVERKKPGLKKARRGPQWAKR